MNNNSRANMLQVIVQEIAERPVVTVVAEAGVVVAAAVVMVVVVGVVTTVIIVEFAVAGLTNYGPIELPLVLPASF